jgi:signal transducing adaptor molecule
VNVVLYSLTVANSLLQNCEETVRRALSSRVFIDSLLKQLANKKAHGTAKLRILELIQQWAEMHKEDDGMGYLIATYEELKRQSNYWKLIIDYQFPIASEPEKTLKKTDSEIQRKKEQEELDLAVISFGLKK